MKKLTLQQFNLKKLILTVFLGCLLIFGGQSLLNGNVSASADTADSPSKLTLSVDKTSIRAGDTFTLTASVSTTNSGKWFALSTYILPLDSYGNADYDLCQYLSVQDSTVSPNNVGCVVHDNLQATDTAYRGIMLGLIGGNIQNACDASEVLEYQMLINVSEDYPLSELTLGMDPTDPANAVVTFIGTAANLTYNYAEDGDYTANKVVVSMKPDVLELTENSSYVFLHLQPQVKGNRTYHYRRAYQELATIDGYNKAWEHGVDDLELERIVLGQVDPRTTIEEFVTNINPAQLNAVRIYNSNDCLIYENGSVVEGLPASAKRIGTGSRIEYGSADNPSDVIYVSVLGDIDGDGSLTSLDSSLINAYLTTGSGVTFDTLEQQLSAYISNNGKISTSDSALLNSILTSGSGVSITDFYYKP